MTNHGPFARIAGEPEPTEEPGREDARLDDLGEVLAEALERRGMRLADLVDALAGTEVPRTEEELLACMRGEREMDASLPFQLRDALALTDEERLDLAMAATFGRRG